MLTIPIEESILYVEPIYIKALNTNALPEQKKVIVYFRNQVVMEDNLEKALERIFPAEKEAEEQPDIVPLPVGTPDATVEELIKKANEAFAAAQNAQRDGNWAEYGVKLTELESLLKRLNEITDEVTNAETPSIQDNQ